MNILKNIFSITNAQDSIHKIITILGFKIKYIKFPHYKGYCPICEKETKFYIKGNWLRDNLLCASCKSIPRNRQLVKILKKVKPNFYELQIHESSPSGAVLKKKKKHCKNYSYSYFYPDIEPGEYNKETGCMCQNLEKMTFPNESFDIVITQDVMEHVFSPQAVFKEIERILKPGGIYIFTVPVYFNTLDKTCKRAELINEKINYIEEPIYHGNPIDQKGSLVTYDYGADFFDIIKNSCNLKIALFNDKDKHNGIDGELLDVFILEKHKDILSNSGNDIEDSKFESGQKYGYAYLQATKEALEETASETTKESVNEL